MASHHCDCHHRSHHHYQTDSTSTRYCCSIDYNPFNCSPPLPPPLPTDQLLQAIASYLLQSNRNPTHVETHHSNFRKHRSKYQHKQKLYHQQHQEKFSSIASLLCRVQALESSLRGYQKYGFDSLQDAAARVIQTHFRVFLVRRSRTLSQLKDLAFIKHTLNSLKSSFSGDTHVYFGAIYQKAMDLLLQLDSIQGDDPMISDEKRSITRDLIRFLDLIYGVISKRPGVSVKTKSTRSGYNINKPKILGATKPVSLDNEQSKMLEHLRERVERISRLTELSENEREAVALEGIDDFDEHTNVLGCRKKGVHLIENGIRGRRHETKPKVKKCVTFCSEVGGSKSSYDHGELVKNLTGEAVEEVMDTSQGCEDDEAMLENGGSTETSDEETTNKINCRNEERSTSGGRTRQ